MKRDRIEVNDRQLACARISSQEGQDYLKGMCAAANYGSIKTINILFAKNDLFSLIEIHLAWVNRSSMTFLARQAFSKIFNSTPDDLDMHLIYDVSHNIAKVEEHFVDGKMYFLCF